jgi:hypothetical protein
LAEKEKSNDPRIVERFGLLAALSQPMHRAHVEAALRAMASGGKLSSEQEAMSRWYFEVHVPKEREIAANAEIVATRHGRKLAWIDLRGWQERFIVSRYAAEMHGADAVATVIPGGVLVGGMSIDQGVDLSFLHGEHNLGDQRISVIGHKSPVRISPIGGKVTESFVAAVRQFILDQL